MGLDMLLYKKIANSRDIKEVGYWRKANQIHKWFVDNVQDGHDDCGEYVVTEEKLTELLGICKQIKESCVLVPGKIRNGQTSTKGGPFVDNIEDGHLMQNSHIAAKLLPSGSGFFFGSTDYDQYYIGNIDKTIEIIEATLSDKDNGDIYYSSSW